MEPDSPDRLLLTGFPSIPGLSINTCLPICTLHLSNKMPIASDYSKFISIMQQVLITSIRSNWFHSLAITLKQSSRILRHFAFILTVLLIHALMG